MARYTAALIGLGRIASTIDDQFVGTGQLLPLSHMASYAEVADITVVGAADPDDEARSRFAAEWNIPEGHLYASYEEMLEATQPDIVSICTTAAPRAEIIDTIAAMVGAGRTHVRCIWAEKPLTLSLSDADRVVEECAAQGLLLVTNTQRPSDPQFQLARSLIDADELGAVNQIVASYQGNLSHNGVHMLATMLFLAGGTQPSGQRVAWVVGDADDGAISGDDDFRANAYLGLTNGARAFLRAEQPGRTTGLDVIGTKGTLRVTDYDGTYRLELLRDLPGVAGGRPAPHSAPLPRPAQSWSGSVGQVRNIVECLDGTDQPNTPGDLGAHLLEVVLAIRESHREGASRVDLPLKERDVAVRSLDAMGGGGKTGQTAMQSRLASGPVADHDIAAASRRQVRRGPAPSQ